MPFYDSIEKAWFEVRSKASHTFASRLYHAVPESFSFAQAILKSQLGDISLEGVAELLLKTAAYVLVSYAASSLIGGAVGGAGAALASRGGATQLGVLAGMRAGLAVNTWVLNLLGFGFMAAEAKMHQEYAFRSYESGLQKLIEPPRSCWNEDSVERAAATDFAIGHAKMLQALIFGIVAYMSKGALQKERALEAMRASKVFGGEKMAEWFAKNWDKLSARQRASAAVTPEMVFGKPAKAAPEPVRPPKPKEPERPLGKLAEEKIPCFHPYDKSNFKKMTELEQKDYLKEMSKQLQGQQDAINQLTANEYKAARDAYKELGRNPVAEASQNVYRKRFNDKIQKNIFEDLMEKGVSPSEAKAQAQEKAKEILSKLAALHEPDMVAGGWGNPEPQAMGRSDVNSSIGASWNQSKRLAQMDSAANDAVFRQSGDALMNVKLEVCRGKGLK